jgi:hypothetical protein
MLTAARKRIVLSLLILSILFSYQNCAPLRFSQGSKNGSLSESGNIDSSSLNPLSENPISGSNLDSNTNPLTPTNTKTPSLAILSTKLEVSSLYFEKPASLNYTLTSMLKFDPNLNIVYHRGFSYPFASVGNTLLGRLPCLKDATCESQKYFNFLNGFNDDEVLQFLVTENSYNGQNTYQLDCSNIDQAFLCSSITQAFKVKQNQLGTCVRKSIPLSSAMRSDLEVLYDPAYSSIYNSLILDEDCLCYYNGVFSDPLFPNQVFHVKSPALASHCNTNFKEYR